MNKYRCPLCQSTIHAPQQMATDDARRLCLECTKETGKITRRARVADLRKKSERDAERKVRVALTEEEKTARAERRLLKNAAKLGIVAKEPKP
jgi:hypothetical protein